MTGIQKFLSCTPTPSSCNPASRFFLALVGSPHCDSCHCLWMGERTVGGMCPCSSCFHSGCACNIEQGSSVSDIVTRKWKHRWLKQCFITTSQHTSLPFFFFPGLIRESNHILQYVTCVPKWDEQMHFKYNLLIILGFLSCDVLRVQYCECYTLQ